MGKMRSGWSFLSEHGFHGSTGKHQSVQGYTRGISKAKGPEAHIKQKGPEKGSAPKAHFPPAPSKKPSTGAEHKYAKGGKVKAAGTVRGGPTREDPAEGGVLPYKKGGKVGYKPEDQEEHESDTGFKHDDVEPPYEHYEAARGGHISKHAKGGMHINPEHKGKFTARHIGVEKGLHSKSKVVREEANFARMAKRHFEPLKKAKGGPVAGFNGKGSSHPEHNHYRHGHKIESHPDGIGSEPHDIGHGYADKHHSPPHGKHGHKAFAKGGKYADGGPTRPPGMPRSPMLGMKRMRHGPNQRQMPGIPGMAPVAAPSLGMGQGTAPKVMKRGGRKC